MNTQDEIRALVVSDSGLEFKGEDFRKMCGHGVYLFMSGAEPLYVGVSKAVLSRASSKAHRQSSFARQQATHVKMWACPTEQAAARLETLLISYLKPIYNTRKRLRADHLRITGYHPTAAQAIVKQATAIQ